VPQYAYLVGSIAELPLTMCIHFDKKKTEYLVRLNYTDLLIFQFMVRIYLAKFDATSKLGSSRRIIKLPSKCKKVKGKIKLSLCLIN
jgi:hypothetical protein